MTRGTGAIAGAREPVARAGDFTIALDPSLVMDGIVPFVEALPKDEQDSFFPFGATEFGKWFDRPGAICLAASDRGGTLVGFVAVSGLLGPQLRYPMLVVAPDARRRGLGTALDVAFIEAAPESGIDRVACNHNHVVGQAFAAARGYVRTTTSYYMSRDPEAFPPQEIEGIVFVDYRGEDDALNAELVAFNNRVYATHADVPRMTEEALASSFQMAGRQMILARERDGGALAGMSDITAQGFVCNLVVARRHWGSGLAHELSRRTIAHAAETGADRVRSFVRASNAASLRMQKRVGMEIDDIVYTYERTR